MLQTRHWRGRGQDFTLHPCVRHPIFGSRLYNELYNGTIKMLPCRSFAELANSQHCESQTFSNGKAKKVTPERGFLNEDSLELARQYNCWRLWQSEGLSIDDITFSLKCNRNKVFSYIFSCVRQGCQIDWFELCKDVQLTPEIADAVLSARGKAKRLASGKKADELDSVKIKKFCPPSVTTIHIGLVHVMLGRGMMSDDILYAVRIAKEDSEPNKMYQCIVENGNRKKIVTELGMLQWLKENNGATLSQIVHNFSDCDEIYLMHLVLYLEQNSLIFRQEGKFLECIPTS